MVGRLAGICFWVVVLGVALYLTAPTPTEELPPQREAGGPITMRFTEREVGCFALNLYHEARGESLAGILAVANVVINRREAPQYPRNLCEIIYEPRQFSWTMAPPPVRKPEVYARLYEFSDKFLRELPSRVDTTDGALFYHATYLGRLWLDQTVVIGNHVFYRRYTK